MSLESAKSFVERMRTDEVFAKKVLACKDEQERIEFVRTEGFDFTIEEIKNTCGKLSDDELDKVSGGGIGVVAHELLLFATIE